MIFRELETTNSKRDDNNYAFVGRDQVRIGIPGRLPVPGFPGTHYDSLPNIQHEKNENIINEPILNDTLHYNQDSEMNYRKIQEHSTTGFGNNNSTCDTKTMMLIIMSIVTCLNCLFLFIILILGVCLCSKK